MKNYMKEYWTADFKEFKKKVESSFGDINKLAPDIYTHFVLSHGFMEYVGIKMVSPTRQNYLRWVKNHKLKFAEEGWEAFLDD